MNVSVDFQQRDQQSTNHQNFESRTPRSSDNLTDWVGHYSLFHTDQELRQECINQ